MFQTYYKRHLAEEDDVCFMAFLPYHLSPFANAMWCDESLYKKYILSSDDG